MKRTSVPQVSTSFPKCGKCGKMYSTCIKHMIKHEDNINVNDSEGESENEDKEQIKENNDVDTTDMSTPKCDKIVTRGSVKNTGKTNGSDDKRSKVQC